MTNNIVTKGGSLSLTRDGPNGLSLNLDLKQPQHRHRRGGTMQKLILASLVLALSWGCQPKLNPGFSGNTDAAAEGDSTPDAAMPVDASDSGDSLKPDMGEEEDAANPADAAPDLGINPDAAPDQGVDTDGDLPDATPPPSCVGGSNGAEETRPCGLNTRGTETRTCADGEWTDWVCEDPDVCTDDESENRECGINSRGNETRTCTEGQWPEEWEDCVDPDECTDDDDDQRVCGPNDNGIELRTCANGRWNGWEPCNNNDVCRNGDMEQEACPDPMNANRERICAGGQWLNWNECIQGPLCEEGATDERECGINSRGSEERTCTDGIWGDWNECIDPDVCIDDDEMVQDCGFNGRGAQFSTCLDGQWADFAECIDPDECRDNALDGQACGIASAGNRQRNCVNGIWTVWGECVEGVECELGDIRQQDCGINSRGTARSECVDGAFGPIGECIDPDVCEDEGNEERACGLNDNGVQNRTCGEGRWNNWDLCNDPDACHNGDIREQACGNNGLQQMVCADGQWPGAFGLCVEGPACEDGEGDFRPCGLNSIGTQNRICENGRWNDWDECVDPDVCHNGDDETRNCGFNLAGTETRSCVNGQWEQWGECADPDVCRNGNRQVDNACGLNGSGSRGRLCESGSWQDWSECVEGDVCENGATRECGVDVGACTFGTETCSDGQWNGECIGATGPENELCNNIDDDCDGDVDEDVGLGAPCQEGLGSCQRQGFQMCDNDGGVTCNVQAGVPENEACNGQDDDCNGVIDDIEPLQGCYYGPDGTVDIGACHAGQQSCQNGEWGACENQVIPGVEICDSVDNDCDDEVDEQGPHADMCEESCIIGATRACYTGPEGTINVGSCGPGQQACDDVSMRWGPCEGETLPGHLQCGNVDNNCDGQVDNVPGGCGFCNPTPEVCDQVDNNCDNMIDNGLPLNACGVCGPAPEEVCNGEDDDCDGDIDEGVQNACGFCGELPQEVCNGFDDDCDGEVDNTGLEEICNGVDDDCDGEIDNGLENCCAGEEISPELACAPSGEFMMGPPDRLHQQVRFTYAFVAFKAETTQNLWNQHMDQNPSVHVGGALPVHNLLISEAAEFANALSLSQDLETCYTFTDNGRVQFSGGLDCRGWRIPTEAEWEYAASAGGNQAGTYGNLQEIAVSSIPPSNNPSPLAVCGGRPTNVWGMCDALGNISELVWNGRYDYIRNVLQIDPSGAPELPDATREIGARGGSWYNANPDQFRSFQRGFDPIDVRGLKGIRLVRTFSHPAW